MKIEFSDCYQEGVDENFDFRNSIHPKIRMQKPDSNYSPLNYYQVFKEKFGFQPNLSFIDLMFNEGPQAIDICSACIRA